MAEESALVGTPMVLSIDGQRVTGKVAAVHADHYEVTIPIHQPAKGYQSTAARAVLPSGQVVQFDLGANAFYARLTVHVPIPTGGSAPAGDERRRFFRLGGFELPFEVIESGPHGRDVVRAHGVALNLSGGGMLAEFASPTLPGIYQFRVQMGADTLEVIGRVLRKGNSTTICPVEFVDIHEVDRTRVIRFIFNRVRALKNGAEPDGPIGEMPEPAPSADDKDDVRAKRRERFGKPNKFRYW